MSLEGWGETVDLPSHQEVLKCGSNIMTDIDRELKNLEDPKMFGISEFEDYLKGGFSEESNIKYPKNIILEDITE